MQTSVRLICKYLGDHLPENNLVNYNQWQNIMGILKGVFKFPPLPLYNVASP